MVLVQLDGVRVCEEVIAVGGSGRPVGVCTPAQASNVSALQKGCDEDACMLSALHGSLIEVAGLQSMSYSRPQPGQRPAQLLQRSHLPQYP